MKLTMGYLHKKLVKAVYVCAAVLMFQGASEWEGAAGVAQDGELPGTGHYAATNSFPKNTVVDVTNLENGKTIRVIVASGLESPGLLAVLSSNAANFLGLRNGSIGRIRMTQPSDPIAFSRFTDGTDAYGESGHDIPSEPAPFIGAEDPAPSTAEDSPVSESGWDEDPLGVAAARPGGEIYGDIPITEDPPHTVASENGAAASENRAAASENGAAVSENRAIASENGVAVSENRAATSENRATASENRAAVSENRATASENRAIASENRAIASENGAAASENRTATSENRGATSENYDYTLVPVEERPPEYLFNQIAEEDIIPGIEQNARENTPPAITTAPAHPAYSSIPVITSLEEGKYYVQIGAFSRQELIEAAVNRIGSGYPLALQNAGSSDKPLYRVLLGPLKPGESGAVLERVKSIGYKDAFIRY